MLSSPATHEQLEERLEELTFLAEAIAEQVKLIDSFQSEYVLPHLGESSNDDSSSETALSITNKFQELIAQFDENLQQRSELAKLESELSRREEKLVGQRKSLTQRFKAEWAKLQVEKLELESLKQLIGEPASPPEAEPAVSIAEVESKLEELSMLLKDSDDENRRLINENKELRRQLAEVAQSEDSGDQSSNMTEIFELKRKLELTLEELQDARSENHRLQSSPSPTLKSGDTWEQTKLALLASLENETQLESCLENPNDLVKSLRESQDLLKQKDQTIKQLEMLLVESNDSATEIHDQHQSEWKQKLIDESEIIAEEKSRLNDLEKQWREKIGEAEIELSKERAKLSRERAALDEKLKSLEELDAEELDAEELDAESGNDRTVSEPQKRKWWERLGLG